MLHSICFDFHIAEQGSDKICCTISDKVWWHRTRRITNEITANYFTHVNKPSPNYLFYWKASFWVQSLGIFLFAIRTVIVLVDIRCHFLRFAVCLAWAQWSGSHFKQIQKMGQKKTRRKENMHNGYVFCACTQINGMLQWKKGKRISLKQEKTQAGRAGRQRIERRYGGTAHRSHRLVAASSHRMKKSKQKMT